jgi:hypothetical protein
MIKGSSNPSPNKETSQPHAILRIDSLTEDFAFSMKNQIISSRENSSVGAEVNWLARKDRRHG